jgi:signal transduction histidine kinase
MNEAVFLGLGLVVGGILGWVMGARKGVRRVQTQVEDLLRAFRTGNPLSNQDGLPGEIPAIGELRAFLGKKTRVQDGEDPSGGPALERMAQYLKSRVEDPLTQALEEEDQELRVWVQSVVDAVEDMRFFLQAPEAGAPKVTANLVDLVGEVTQEFSPDLGVRLKVDAPPGPLRLQVDPEPLKDALFLILHNAGEFGDGGTVDMTLRKTEEAVHILVRDHGPGFTAEALIKAMDPFYSTTPAGLGLGLPYARAAVKGQGGDVILRNAEEGGGEVEIVLPQE